MRAAAYALLSVHNSGVNNLYTVHFSHLKMKYCSVINCHAKSCEFIMYGKDG